MRMGRVGRLVFGVDRCFGNFYWDNFKEKMDICRLILFIPFLRVYLDIGKLERNLFYFIFSSNTFREFSFPSSKYNFKII